MKIKFKPKDKNIISGYRIKKGFLWLPKKIGLEMRWLEYAEWEEYYLEANGRRFFKTICKEDKFWKN